MIEKIQREGQGVTPPNSCYIIEMKLNEEFEDMKNCFKGPKKYRSMRPQSTRMSVTNFLMYCNCIIMIVKLVNTLEKIHNAC